jgi:hypothetical protein
MEFKHYSEAPKNVADAIITLAGSNKTAGRSALDGLRRLACCPWHAIQESVETLNSTRASSLFGV